MILKSVVVAAPVDEATANMVRPCNVSFAYACTESVANGDEVPTPRRLLVGSIDKRSAYETAEAPVQ